MKRLLTSLIIISLICGCASIDTMALRTLNFVEYSANTYTPLAKDYPVDIFFEGSPSRPYEVIGEILGYVDQGYSVRRMLIARVRQVGGDAAINITTKAKTRKESEIVDVIKSGPKGRSYEVPVAKTNYFDVIKVSAKVIKYKQ